MKTLISVIIPSYNRANTVGQTIESIVSQKVNANIEIIIGDDCSTDNAREVLLQYKEKYPDIIRLFFWEENIFAIAIMMTIGIIPINCNCNWITWKHILCLIS